MNGSADRTAAPPAAEGGRRQLALVPEVITQRDAGPGRLGRVLLPVGAVLAAAQRANAQPDLPLRAGLSLMTFIW